MITLLNKTGIIDKSFYETNRYRVCPKNKIGLLKFCITISLLGSVED